MTFNMFLLCYIGDLLIEKVLYAIFLYFYNYKNVH